MLRLFVFVLTVSCFFAALLLGSRCRARAWWSETHREIFRGAELLLRKNGFEDTAESFFYYRDLIINGAVAPDNVGDIDFDLTGGAHYCIPTKKRLNKNSVPYCKRAGFSPFSKYMKSACTIAEENYTMAVLYAVNFKKSGRLSDIDFAYDCIGRAIHALSDAASVPHSTGKRMLGKKSFHYNYEKKGKKIGNTDFAGKEKQFFEAACLSAGIKDAVELLDYGKIPEGNFVRALVCYLSMSANSEYYRTKNGEREALLEDSSVNNILCKACAAVAVMLVCFDKDVCFYENIGEFVTGKKDNTDNCDVFKASVYGKKKAGFSSEISLRLRAEFPSFEKGFRLARSESFLFYITDEKSRFKRIFTIRRGELIRTVFAPGKKSSFVKFHC